MFIYDGECYWMYVLAARKWLFQQAFFTRDNYVHGYFSTDFVEWKDIGPVILPQGPERICSGSLTIDNGTMYFFFSSSVKQYSLYLLDQRVFLATSDDGKSFCRIPGFVLDPDPKVYPTRCYDPITGSMMFAWRDPFYFKDPKSGKSYLFICAGAERWGVPPTVAVAWADEPGGPYKLLPPAITIPTVSEGGKLVPVLGEIERVQIHYRNGAYHMLFSTWKGYVASKYEQALRNRGIELTNSSTYVAVSKHVEGPYLMDAVRPTVEGSENTGMYGCLIVKDPFCASGDFAVGWNNPQFTVTPSMNIKVLWETDKVRFEC